MKQTLRKYESGQAIILIALMIVALAGITGLALDGGSMYFLHRDTQNAVDAAVLAATYAKCTTNNVASEIESAAVDALTANAFDDGINGVTTVITANYDPITHAAASPPGTSTAYVKVTLTAFKPSYFIQLVYPEPLYVTTSGVGYCIPASDALIPHAAIVSLRPDSGSCNNSISDASISWNGTGYLEILNSGIYTNSTSSCAITAGSNATDLIVHGDCATAADPYAEDDTHDVVHCDSNTGGADDLGSDLNPLSDMDKPDDFCGQTAQDLHNYDGPDLNPGHYEMIDIANSADVRMNPGIYCVEQIVMQGGILRGDGVVLYFPDSPSQSYNADRFSSSGSPEFELYAPTTANCVNSPSTGNTCDWIDLLMWVDINEDNGCAVPPGDPCNGQVYMNGGADSDVRGTIYAPGSGCGLDGHGDWNMTGTFICWGFQAAGNSNMVVAYDQPEFLQTPPRVSYAE
jgi:hypothetical protein